MEYLTTQDLRLAYSCPTKLYYKKHGYPMTLDLDSYRKSLSDGYLIIQKIAQLLYPEGILCEGVADTSEKLAKAGTLFQASACAHYKFACIDILSRQQQKVDIIHVKNRSFDSKANTELGIHRKLNIFRSKRTGEVNSDWRPVMEDIAWQKLILMELYPDWEIHTYLLMPDRYKTTQIKHCLRQFRIYPDQRVEFLGDVQALRASHFLSLVPVDAEVMAVMPRLKTQAEIYIQQLLAGFPRPVSQLGKHCRDCEFKSGYQECWGELAQVEPHIFDLYQVGRMTLNGKPLVNELVQQGKASMYDVPLGELSDSTYSHRQLIQIEYTQKNREWIAPQLKKILSQFTYPLHFLDFETARVIIPWDAGLRPNEQVAFQWSCHTIDSPNADPVHDDWIDIDTPFPNWNFVQSLWEKLAPTGEPVGTILTWGSHEFSVLKDIQRQITIYGSHHLPISRKLDQLVQKGKFVDMDNLTRSYYFHPLMKYKTSLKWVIAAIWKTNSYLHTHPYFSSYIQIENGEVISPYASLPKQWIDDREVTIMDGSEAMLAYLEIICGAKSDRPEIVSKWVQLLKQYCSLDTLAMVMIWYHWHTQLAIQKS
ncbi:MAG: DUF2779 domain-containing protein [Pseudanabaenaceae cyanobacterium]